jgi:hypothetical protein
MEQRGLVNFRAFAVFDVDDWMIPHLKKYMRYVALVRIINGEKSDEPA